MGMSNVIVWDIETVPDIKGFAVANGHTGKSDEDVRALVEVHFRASRRASMAKATKPTSASKTSRPVTLKHLAATLAEQHQLTKRAGEALLGDLVGLITKHLKKGERIRIAGLGILQVRKLSARMGRNPPSGEVIKSKALKKARSVRRAQV